MKQPTEDRLPKWVAYPINVAGAAAIWLMFYITAYDWLGAGVQP